MFRKKIVFIFLLFTLSLCVNAQKKKEIRKYGIKSVTATKSDGVKTIKDEKLTYNASGLLTEELKYNEEGELESVTRYKYNASEDVTEESVYDAKNVLTEKRTMKYNYLSQKTEELVVDKDGKQLKKFTYSYDSKGLRTEKKTYDAANVLRITKKTVYSYK